MQKLIISTAFAIAILYAWMPSAMGAEAQGKAILQNNNTFEKPYAEQLKAKGYTIAHADFQKDVITYEGMKRFSQIWIDTVPPGGAYYCLFPKQLLFRKNLETAFKCVEEGAGMIMFIEGSGGNAIFEYNRILGPLGMKVEQSCYRDTKRQFAEWKSNGSPSGICWTENINQNHPATKDIKRVYYPSGNLRWDDMYTSSPLHGDSNWTALVSPMADAETGVITQEDNQYAWQTAKLPTSLPSIMSVRQFGKGYVAVIGINPVYLHRTGYTKTPGWGEADPGEVDGVVMEKGDGKVPSDMAKLLVQLSEWMAAPALAAGFGGYKEGEALAVEPHVATEEEKAFKPVLDHETGPMPKSWKHCPTATVAGDKTYYAEFSDPRVPGEVKFFKALVGVHSALSDGQGQVEDYVKAAKAAGYSVISFAESFADITPEKYATLVKECERLSTDDFYCVPGFEIADSDNNRYIIAGAPVLPRKAWLNPDGKRIEQVPYLNLGMFNHMVIAHRPNSCPLSIERLKHFQGLSVFTYQDGQLADNSLSAFQWQVRAGSNPHPVVVHEVHSPAEVEKAAKLGLQQILPSDTVNHAGEYFREGLDHYFEAPSRYMISSGPIVDTFAINSKDAGPDEENRQQFRIDVGVTSETPLVRVTLYDGYEAVRRWSPAKDAKTFAASAFFHHDKQYGLYVIAEDAKGGFTITNSIRTVPTRFHFRCSDRQNWLGPTDNWYSGAFLSLTRDNEVNPNARYQNEWKDFGTDMRGVTLASRLDFPFTTPDVLLTDNTLDETYVTANWNDIGLDCKPSRLGKRSSLYEGYNRRWNFTGGPNANNLNFALVETQIRMSHSVQAAEEDNLFIWIFTVEKDAPYWFRQNGQVVTGKVEPELKLDLPIGAVIGGRVIAQDGLSLRQGRVGFLPKADSLGMVTEGRVFKSAFIIPMNAGYKSGLAKDNPIAKDPEKWWNHFNAPSYQIALQSGKFTNGIYPRGIAASEYGVAGKVEKQGGEPFMVPLKLEMVNANWSCGIWREGEAYIQYTGVREGCAYPRLNVSKPGAFYAGNMVLADNPGLVLSIIKWDKDSISVEAHNPTSQEVKAHIWTPKAVQGCKALDTTLAIPAGSSARVKQ